MRDPCTLSIKFSRPDGLVATVSADPGKVIMLGRDLSCDVRLDGRKVSRRHLRIENRPDGAVLLFDNGSHNGTYVNGARVTEATLNEGDLVQAGEWEGKVELKPRGVAAAGAARGPAAVNVGAVAPGMMPAIQVQQQKGNGGMPYNASDPRSRDQQTQSSGIQRPDLAEVQRAMGGDVFGAEITDPETQRQQAQQAQQQQGPKKILPASGGAPPFKSTQTPPPITTKVMAIPDWKWEDSAPSTEALRTARVEDNPIVRRFTESQVNLDFRGLQELSAGLSDSPQGGLKPTSPQAIDGIALRLVFKVTEALANAESMDHFLAEMCDSLQGAARAKAVIVLLPDETGALVPRVVKLRRPDERVQLSRTVIKHAVESQSALTTEDAAADERFARGESVLRFDLKAVLACPLLRGGDVVGCLYITRDLPFSNTERDLVAALGQLIAMGLERSRLREQKRSLERFHAPEVVRKLMMESTTSSAARGDGLFLEPLTSTVMFCDLSGFTKWCEAHDAELVGKVLNAYLGAMSEQVFAHKGTVDKFIGDAIMCIFGAPFMATDDPIRAVRCAVQMRKTFRDLVAAGVAGDDARGLDVHIGINTGKVVAGTVGSPMRMEYTALGDTVNIAARLEGVAKAGQIVIGPTTAALVQGQIKVRSLGPVALKGKSETVEAFEVPDE